MKKLGTQVLESDTTYGYYFCIAQLVVEIQLDGGPGLTLGFRDSTTYKTIRCDQGGLTVRHQRDWSDETARALTEIWRMNEKLAHNHGPEQQEHVRRYGPGQS